MPRPSARLALGFAAGAVSHLLVQGGLGALFHAAGLIAEPVLHFDPVGPLGVPFTLNNMFWDGLWGLAYGAAEPGLTRRVGRGAGGLVTGLAALLVFWFLVLPLKGAAPGGGFRGSEPLVQAILDLAFGLGVALIYHAVRRPRRAEG